VRTLLLVLLFAPAIARAEAIAVASTDARFTAAVAETFASAGMTIVPVADVPQGVADLASDARRLADREHATATVWLVAGEGAATLVAYDRGVDRMLVRALPYRPPLTEAQGAEVARMARAMLRSLRVTPEVDLPPPPATEAAAVRAHVATILAAPAPPPAAPDRIALGVGFGVRVGAPGATASQAADVDVIWRPDAIGIAASAGIVFAQPVEHPAFTGEVSDLAVGLTARVPLRLSRWLVVAGDAGAALHRIELHGTAGAMPVGVTRYDPAIRAGATAIVALHPGVAIGVAMSGDGLLRRQRYQVGTAEVLDVPVAQLSVGVVLLARLL
jgi:hypothetical protein